MPPQATQLTKAQERRLRAAWARAERTQQASRDASAELVETMRAILDEGGTQAAIGRVVGLTRSAVLERVRRE